MRTTIPLFDFWRSMDQTTRLIIRRVLVLGLLAITPSLLTAQSSDGTTAMLERRSPSEVAVEPGGSATIVFRLTNTSTVPDTLITTASPPSAWRLVSPDIRVGLEPQESHVEFVTVSAPLATPAGRYVVRYTVQSEIGKRSVTDSIVVRVDRQDNLSVINELAPAFVVEGEPLDLTFYVVNAGNAPAVVKLRTSGQAGDQATLSWTEAQLDAGETRPVKVSSVQRTSFGDMVRRGITLRAYTTDNVKASATVLFQVVPRGKDRSVSQKFPMQVSLRAGTGRSTAIGRVEGRGYFNERKTIGLDFWYEGGERSAYFRTPNLYSMTLRAPGFELAAGNRFWDLSPLTEPGRFDPGVGVKFNNRTFFGGGHFVAGSRRFVAGSQGAGYIGAHVNPKVDLSAQYLVRRSNVLSASQVNANASIGSIRAVTRPFTGVSADIELATGTSATGSGWARTIGVSATRGSASVVLRHAKASDEYPVWDRNLIGNSASFNVTPFKYLRVNGGYNTIERMYNPTTDLFIPDRRRGGHLSFGFGRYLNLMARRDEWTNDTMSWNDGAERIAYRASLKLPIGRLTFDPRVEIARATQIGTSEILRTVSAGMGVTTRLPASGSLTARIDRVKRRPTLTGSDWWSGLISTNFQPFTRTRVSLSASQSSFENPWDASARWLDAAVDQQVFGHRITASVRSYSGRYSGPSAKAIYRLDYVLPIGVPLPTQNSAGSAVVRLTETETGEPLIGILVRIGDQAMVTDASGEARFRNLTSGDNYLIVPPTALGPGRITQQPMPMRVIVQEKQTQRIEIVVARSARISGSLRQFNEDPSVARAGIALGPMPTIPVSAKGPNNNSSDDLTLFSDDPIEKLVDVGGITGAIVELVTSAGNRFATTDANGHFEFENVPPGAWTLRIVSVNVPPFYYLDRPKIEGIGKPGDDTKVLFRIIPKRRIISEEPVREISNSRTRGEGSKGGGLSD